MINQKFVIIAGVNKAATTSLFSYLKNHPQICPSNKKETGHFLHIRYGMPTPPLSHYQRFFPDCQNAKYFLEATGGYFYGGVVVVNEISRSLLNPKIIIVLREPISRLFSFYKFKKNMLELDERVSFEEYIEICEKMSFEDKNKKENNVFWGIDGGFYSKYIQDWLDAFSPNDIRILFFDDIIDRIPQVLDSIYEWLEIKNETREVISQFSIENKSVKYKFRHLQKIALKLNWRFERFWRSHPTLKNQLRRAYYSINGSSAKEKISDTTYQYLKNLYHPYNVNLCQILTQAGYTNLPEWLEMQ